MVHINRIYTRLGDEGQTNLVGGAIIQKDSLRVGAYGEVDELNSFVGAVRSLTNRVPKGPLGEYLAQVQNELFDIGAILATPPTDDLSKLPSLSMDQVGRLERWIDKLIDGLPELKSFVIPGGTELNSALHICRSVCRRAERNVLRLSRAETVPKEILIYLNRLSDLFFAMARYESKVSASPEYLWKPGGS